MKKILTLFAFAMAMCPLVTFAQGTGEFLYRLDATTNGTTVSMATVGGAITIRDDDSQGQGAPDAGWPMRNIDYSITVLGNCSDSNEARLVVNIVELQVNKNDTVYIYDGGNTSAPLIKKFNNYYGDVQEGDFIFITPTNNSNLITIRFVTGATMYESSDAIGKGFEFNVHCRKPCESLTPVIDSLFYRTRHGIIYDSAYTRLVTIYDTVYVDEDDPTSGIDHIDTNTFLGAHLCIGDGVIFKGHGDYSFKYGYYTPSDATSYFTWDMANDGDTIQGVGMSSASYTDYQKTGCYDLVLSIVDVYGCSSNVRTSVKVRTSSNPIKTIFTLQDICNNDSLMVNMGYSGEDATLTLREIENNETVSKTYECVTFIPDGCNCTNPNYFEAPVEFTEFPNTSQVTRAKDICSICINMEHTFMGDIYMTIVCPTGKEALLKFGNSVQCSPEGLDPAELGRTSVSTESKNTGGGTHLGWATHDDGGQCSDPWMNRYGIGLDYCFSRNDDYTLITGDNAAAITSSEPNPAGPYYLGSSTATITTTDPVYGIEAILGPGNTSLPACPDYVDDNGMTHPFPAGAPSISGSTTRHPSNHAEKTDYYLPFTDFTPLVGCPLNGTWKVRIYDTWNIDNGWIFNWSLDICGVSQNNDCRYQVGIDSLVWRPDPSPQYHDYDMGHYRGVKINAETPTISHISSPDTAGRFRILVNVYDEFGCVWDTNTFITSYWTPQPDLGPDTSLCGVDKMVLDARDDHTATESYSYVWSTGQNTPTITSLEGAAGDQTYVVQVTNTRASTTCITQDTIFVQSRRQPMPSFIPSPFVFEGCAPFTIHFDNRTLDATEHMWVFGDGVTSTEVSPTHTYAAGIYDLRYYATSADGCVDSIVSPQSIAVYNAPQAGFSWTPTYPSVLNPVATFTNLTEPQTPWTKYFWEIQYNIDYPRSVETLTDVSPSFDFSQWTDEDPSGNYAVRLIARTDNQAPSGNMVYCRDTAENTILVVNDFLQFPNVVSPNGDGINDRFVIKNLVKGMGYPINQLDIYNKWGTRVFHKENITRDEDFWDPKDMPAGTYFYRFSAKGYNGNIEHNGAIEVVR